ncbi:MAG TPA: hydroxyisourate hydrolase, partial [Micromonosporaceae bacterium]|nr:hydroxyisourate hydrolase [Micromonosporaceae bacterium]
MSLSTHVLDTERGEPAAGVPVLLERRAGDGWVTVASGTTGDDGRLGGFVPDEQWGAGRYRLTFSTAGVFFPEVSVVFEVSAPDRHHHVPL